ncbi:hypothetical protein ABW21_db0201780 [Orbilia brochopaga]|nr:hypothetical protein ABW21_db0201780 [Drechslerella brochopaga]
MGILNTLLTAAVAFSMLASAVPVADGPGNGAAPPPQHDSFLLRIQGSRRYNGQYVGYEESRRNPGSGHAVPVDRRQAVDHWIGRRAGNLHVDIDDRSGNRNGHSWEFERNRQGGPGGNSQDYWRADIVQSDRNSNRGDTNFDLTRDRDSKLEWNRDSARNWLVCEENGRQGRRTYIAYSNSRRGLGQDCERIDLVSERSRGGHGHQ